MNWHPYSFWYTICFLSKFWLITKKNKRSESRKDGLAALFICLNTPNNTVSKIIFPIQLFFNPWTRYPDFASIYYLAFPKSGLWEFIRIYSRKGLLRIFTSFPWSVIKYSIFLYYSKRFSLFLAIFHNSATLCYFEKGKSKILLYLKLIDDLKKWWSKYVLSSRNQAIVIIIRSKM